MPDPETSGVLPEIREDIETIQRYTPDWVQIGLPDMQGPFNIAHVLLGEEAFIAPYEEPEKFADLMTLITDFFIAVHERLCRWIDPARLPAFPVIVHRIAECSVNLISSAMYLEHVLPADRRIAKYYGQVAVHPCSGPHVFHATLSNLPNVCYQEAGYIEKTCAGAISVTAALEAIGERPMILNIGEELPLGGEEAVIRAHFNLARRSPRLLFGYTGMYWTRDDEPLMRDLHLRLDDYWETEVWQTAQAYNHDDFRTTFS